MQAGQVVSHPYVYMQPAFFTTSQTQRTELILRMKLSIVPASGGTPIDFTWNSVGTWQLLGSIGQVYIISGDAGPLIVNSSNPQTPICEFDGPTGWGFKAGTYNVTLTADRALVSTPLQTSFSFSVGQGALDTISHNRGYVVLNINRLTDNTS